MINDNDNTADVGKAKTDANALSDQAAGASHSKEAKVTNGATECKDQPSADCAVEINFNDVENDPEFEDPNMQIGVPCHLQVLLQVVHYI